VAEDAVSEVIFADHFASTVILRDQFRHTSAQNRPAIARAWRRRKAFTAIPPLSFIPTGNEASKPGFTRLVFSFGNEPLSHRQILVATSLRRNDRLAQNQASQAKLKPAFGEASLMLREASKFSRKSFPLLFERDQLYRAL
jgi:hypothetical protein